MTSGISGRKVVLCFLLVALVALAGCSRPPQPKVCGACGHDFERSAEFHGVNVTVEGSQVDGYLREDGTARWVVRTNLSGPGVERLRTNESLRTALVEDATARRGPEPKENVTAHLDGNALVVSYTVPDFADRTLGVLVVDEFNRQNDGFDERYRVPAARFRLHAPDGMTVLNRPPGGSVTEETVGWTGVIDEKTYVVVGSPDAWAAGMRGQTAIAVAVLEWAGVPAAVGGALPAGALLVLARIGLSTRDPADAAPASGRELLVAGGGLLLSFVALLYVIAMAGTDGGGLALVIPLPVVLFAALGSVATSRPITRWTATLALSASGYVFAFWAVLAFSAYTVDSVFFVSAIWLGLVVPPGGVLFWLARPRVNRTPQRDW